MYDEDKVSSCQAVLFRAMVEFMPQRKRAANHAITSKKGLGYDGYLTSRHIPGYIPKMVRKQFQKLPIFGGYIPNGFGIFPGGGVMRGSASQTPKFSKEIV